MGWCTHAAGTDDLPEVRNWRIHFVALVVSMSALASMYEISYRTSEAYNMHAVGYDTAVIGGTMALDSFKRCYGLDTVSTTDSDTIQGNIVSTFQVLSITLPFHTA